MVSLVRWCGLARLVVVGLSDGLVDDVPCGGKMVYLYGFWCVRLSGWSSCMVMSWLVYASVVAGFVMGVLCCRSSY